MFLVEPLIQAIEEEAGKVLKRVRLYEPPIDAILVAHRLGAHVMVNENQKERGVLHFHKKEPVISVIPDRPERVQWAVGHEIGELMLTKVARDFGLDAWEREESANHFTRALRMPRDCFIDYASSFRGDVRLAKAKFTTASYELVGMRLLDVSEEPYLLTVIDNGKVTKRVGKYMEWTKRLHPIEVKANQQAERNGFFGRAKGQGVEVAAWAVHEPNQLRQIVRTRPIN